MSVSRVPAVAPIPAENIAALNVDIEQLKSNLDTDFDLIKQSQEWQSAKSKNDEAWTFKEANDKSGVSWIRVRGDLAGVPIEAAADLLDTHLESRQAEWHDLFLGGSVLAQLNEKDPHVELAYFRYKSPMMFVSPRETLYTKARRETRDEQGHLTSLLLSYRSVDENAEIVAKDSKCERITLKSAHLLERTIVDHVESTVYWCIQWSNPGGMLSKFAGLTRDGQLNTMIQEIEGVRKACKNSTVEPKPAATVEATEETKPEVETKQPETAVAADVAVALVEQSATDADEPVVAEEKVVVPEPVVVAAVATQPEEQTKHEEPVQAEEPAQPQAVPEAVPEPEATPAAVAEVEVTPEPEATSEAKPEPEATPEPEVEAEVEVEAEIEASPEAVPEPEAAPEASTEEVVESTHETQAEAQAESTEAAIVAEPATDSQEQEPAAAVESETPPTIGGSQA